MSDFSIINLKDIGEPAAEVANNVINKVGKALSWSVSPKGLQPYVNEGHKSIIEEIAARQDINPIERAALLNNYKKIIKEYSNQNDVLNVALQHLNANAQPSMVEDDWITCFFEKAKLISESDMQYVWGRLLAGEFNEPNTYTKQLVHTLSIMDSQLALRFQRIRSSCFFVPPHLYTLIYRSNNDSINNINRYERKKIFFADMRELENIGIIQYGFPNFYTIKNSHKKLYYGNNVVSLHTEKKTIYTGNVSLTAVGKQLCRIAPMEFDEEIFAICMDAWTKLGYNPTVEITATE